MCYAIPGKVKHILDKKIVVDYFGEEKRAINEFHDLSVGDYVCAQGGYVIKKVSAQEAEEILSAWKELFFELQDIDVRLSRFDAGAAAGDSRVKRILDKALEGIPLQKEEALYLMSIDGREDEELLLRAANFLRQKFHKNSCCVHGIIEFSNYCRHYCRYCGISASNRVISRYRMTPEEIVASAEEAVQRYGFQALVLQSGEDPDYSVEQLIEITKRIKERLAVLICISFGEVGLGALEKLYHAGARALLMRFETSNAALYEKLHPPGTFGSRLEHIKKARELGFLILTGALIGLPGQTPADIVNDIYLAKELGAEMYSFGPFLPHPQTPLSACKPPEESLILKTIALIRLIDPENAKVLVTTAFESLYPDARRKGLLSGANSVMLNVTPLAYRKHYSLYPNRAYADVGIDVQIKETISLLQSLGRSPTDLGVRA